ncbi:zinc metallochaperone AztD [Nocardia sp. CDC159]|uniref:Zinc metallochaperone AztD n=1 Tax=Nocardia pulmonis TaxID=2951408 RepID=A0A9X2E448_9NOCA|nr:MULTISPECIES: zinc metallochaperone AztD [Nocardia]MCM6773494.1 zinc metallochaperone AztD [Nocardia pulmonis]MCM6786381.1 zinc metallochaperone AztD [Nocardia sp. CDC159]
MRLPAHAAAVSGVMVAIMALTGCGTADSGRAAIADPVAVTYDGGIYLLDGRSLTVAGEVKLEGFNRLNPAGDDRHVLVSTSDGFRVLDAARGRFTDTTFAASEPGHVVRHGGRTVLFADGSGEVTVFDPHELGSGTPRTETYRAAAPHHGVAVRLTTGELVVTVGTAERRTGVAVLDRDRREIARNEDCPGVHGESAVRGEAVVMGCQTGALIYRNGSLTKVTSPTPYGRIGNQAGNDASPIALGDYKQDRDAELERPQRISLIDTRDASLRLVDIGTSYTFRSLARGPRGEALVLGTDGRVHVVDPVAGTVVRRIEVIGPWEEPLRWQEPRPAIFVRGNDVYVSDPATRKVHRVDLAAGAVTTTVTLPGVPNELSGVAAGH